MKFRNWMLIGAVVGLLAACGGGGGGSGGGESDSAIPTPTQSASITSSATTAVVNDQITLSWSSVGATNCTATGGWSGTLAASGSQSVQLTFSGTANYGVSCGAQTASVSVKVLNQYVSIPDAVFADALTRVGYPVSNGHDLLQKFVAISKVSLRVQAV